MSQKALRYQGLHVAPVKREPRQTRHHVPPTHPDKQPRFLKKVDERHHAAYHMLFGAAASFEEASEILKRDWWTPPALNGERQ